MSEKSYEVLEKAILTAPMLLALGEFDTDKNELVAEQRELSKQNPDDLIPTIIFIFKHGYIEYEYLFAILKNNSLTQDGLFHLLLLFITVERGSIEKADVTVYEIGSLNPEFDQVKFEWFLIEHIGDCATQVAKNILVSRRVLKKLVLQKGDDCVALEAAISLSLIHI